MFMCVVNALTSVNKLNLIVKPLPLKATELIVVFVHTGVYA